MGDACATCRGHGRVPAVRGAYDVWRRCWSCAGTGRRGGAVVDPGRTIAHAGEMIVPAATPTGVRRDR